MKTVVSKFTRIASAIGMASLLIACGGGETSSSAFSTSGAVIEGTATKGVVENGLVRAYALESIAGRIQQSSSPLDSYTRTDSNGEYSLQLPSALDATSVIIEISADSLTRMICDNTQGCGLDQDGQAIEFGDRYQPGDDFSISAMATNIESGAPVSLHVTPLSELALAYATNSVDGLTPDSFENAKTYIENLMGLTAGALDLPPIDITRLEDYSEPTREELEISVFIASFLTLVDGDRFETIGQVVDNITEQLSEESEWVEQSNADDQASLSEILLGASIIANDMLAETEEESVDTLLGSIGDATLAAYDEIEEGEQQPVAVAIVSHPASTTIELGAAYTLSVVATGSDLSYQWYLDNNLIQGANSSAYSVSNSSIENQGIYNVRVSNSISEAVSSSALVSINMPQDDSSDEQGGSDDGSQDVADNDNTGGSDSGDGSGQQDGSGSDGSDSNDSGSDDGDQVADNGSGSSEDEGSGEGSGDGSDGGVGDDASDDDTDTAGNNSGSDGVLVDVEIEWQIPSTRQDGSALALYEIQGYRVSYGTNPNELNSTVNISGGSEDSIVIEDLASGIYYFSVVTIDLDDAASAATEAVSIEI